MTRAKREWVSIAAVMSGCVALALGSWVILTGGVDRAVRRDAEDTALAWARHFAAQLPDIRDIAAGAAPLPASRAVIQQAARVGNVFRFKIFDANGRLRLVSDELGRNWDAEPSLALHNPPAAAVVRTGQPYTEVKHGRPPSRPPLYAETYLPITIGGQIVGIVEVYIDQTGKEALFREQFALSGLAIALLAGFAFGIPGIALHIRSRQKQRADERIRFLAEHDGMTGLANRAAFLAALEAAVQRRQGDRLIGVHHVDLDRFKSVNDALGHDVGDELIRVTAERIRACVPESCFVARLGGDEFAVLQPGIMVEAEAEALAALIVEDLSAQARVLGHDLTPAASVGSTIAPRDGTSVAALMKNADLALYAAKSAGRNGYRMFTSDLEDEQRQRLRLEALIRRAASEGSFDLHFQPIVDGQGGALASFEALLRLVDDEGVFVPPDVFIPVAEEMGLIRSIGALVVERACRAAAAWPDHLTVSVNLSPLQFVEGDLVEVVRQALAHSGLDPQRLELEITEGLLLSDTETVLAQLSALKALGVRIAMDDFGTGYSSLSYLWRFPFDKIKIDRSFMRAFDAKGDSANVLRTIVSLGHSLRMEVTAEGVETGEQAAFLKEVACDYIQGFLFGRPLPVTEVAAKLLADGRPVLGMLPERVAVAG